MERVLWLRLRLEEYGTTINNTKGTDKDASDNWIRHPLNNYDITESNSTMETLVGIYCAYKLNNKTP